MKKENWILIIIGLVFIITPFLLNFYHFFRLMSLLIGIIITLLGLIIFKTNKAWKIIVYPIILITVIILGDFFLASVFKRVPVIAIEYRSSSFSSTYNSLFYRVYNCNEVLTFDANYEKNFVCNKESLELTAINKFLESPKENFEENHGKFVRLEGKINTIVGNSSLTLNAYADEKNLNGYVVFDEHKKVIIDGLKINPNDFHIYDYIEVIGLVKDYQEKDEKITIYLTDAKVFPSELYQNYEVVVNEDKTLTKNKIEDKLYYLGLKSIYYKYDENNIYELEYLMSDKRESVDNLLNGLAGTIINEKDELYTLEKYNIVKCENNDVVFVNQDINNFEMICDKEN
ncbi:MAG: hypothetical protein E7164_01670 [Firmicutes bacterium]|nr:hypothetical protein [Bacillota bacterium]